ncbi:hypothetical protein L8R85_23430 [Vibrio splendidus]|uniref:Uncharacterized protein n=2 Tax=Vibrio TaxID=662 RepID=A0AA43JZM4_VIBSP|nr:MULTISPECIES: hypothetical protein [Vibrio]MDH5923971.1 hypothetical protein [Vibrio splendidus]TCM99753.1 hypothetical protein EDB35_1491 [Vibrio crassostreae]CDT50541.1 hypothetical protein VCR5J5_460001 [Vibrio crassostreae]CDT50925.1 hypothetical protein VCR20J5_460001 [Vibrio crassostreae]
MQVRSHHLKVIRESYKIAPNPNIIELYCDMVDSIRPMITNRMMHSAKLIVDGKTLSSASCILGISHVAVSQSAIKGLRRLVMFYSELGGTLPRTLNGDFSLPEAKAHLDVLSKAIVFFENPEQSLYWLS